MPHIHYLHDFTVGAIIVYNDKVLLINHPRYKKWLHPGGHIELDEDPDTAVLREVEEETGLTVRVLGDKPNIQSDGVDIMHRPHFVDVHDANPPHRHIGLFYVCIAQNDAVKISDEHEGYVWVSQEQLDDPKYNLSPSLKYYSLQAIKLAQQQ